MVLSGTEIAYGAIGQPMSGTDLVHGAFCLRYHVRYCALCPRASYSMSVTHLPYGATYLRYMSVLTERMVLPGRLPCCRCSALRT
eukprot:1538593-Rhodomonas_salina.1